MRECRHLMSQLCRAQIFGPVLAVATFSSEEEAIKIANNSEYGLGAAVVSNDKAQSQRVANALEAGIVWINCSQPTFVQAPWGGTKVCISLLSLRLSA